MTTPRDVRGTAGEPGKRSVGGQGGQGGEGGKGGEGRVGKPGGPGGRGGRGGEGGRFCDPDLLPVVVHDIAPSVNYKNTLRYIAVMLTAIVIILVFEGIARWM